jgi:phosphoserine aminotransferase
MAVFLTPGPAQTYPKLRAFMEDAWSEDVMSLSHRGAAFSDIYRRTDGALRELMGVPTDWQIMFVGSATEAMERLVQGLVRRRSHHYVNGAFSKKWYQIAGQLGKSATAEKAKAGAGFGGREFEAPALAELVCITLNETSTGVAWPEHEVARLRARHGSEVLLAVDVVSAAPVMPVPWAQADAAFFSVQKAFGLPAGLGVLMLGPRAQARAQELAEGGGAVGSYHSLPELLRGAAKAQTPATPNVLGIYLLGRVAGDMTSLGSGELRAENAKRAAALYEAIEAHGELEPFVAARDWRSPTVGVAEVRGGSARLHDHMVRGGFVPGLGYGELQDRHIRLANFPAISRREFEAALAHLEGFR